MRTFCGATTSKVLQGLSFLKARAGERSTWLMIGGAVAAASALPAPWSYFSLAVGIIAGMVPDNDHHFDH